MSIKVATRNTSASTKTTVCTLKKKAEKKFLSNISIENPPGKEKDNFNAQSFPFFMRHFSLQE